MKQRIYAYLRGGLGNQMFIYAAARAAQMRYWNGEGEILLSGKNFYRALEPMRADEYLTLLKGFRIHSSAKIVKDFHLPIGKRVIKKVCGYRLCKNQREIYEKAVRMAAFSQKFGVIACESGYIDLAEKMPCKIYMDSFFQSEQFFKGIKPVLKKEFQLSEELSENLKSVADQMQNTESVCLAVRLGDYVNHPLHQVCTPNYYQNAILRMRQIKPKCRFYLFSDDIQQAGKMINLPEKCIVEPQNCSNHETLWLMSNCKNFIISNSSFHWWAQYLGDNPNKIVIAPSRWYSQDVPCDLYMKNWEIINV